MNRRTEEIHYRIAGRIVNRQVDIGLVLCLLVQELRYCLVAVDEGLAHVPEVNCGSGVITVNQFAHQVGARRSIGC